MSRELEDRDFFGKIFMRKIRGLRKFTGEGAKLRENRGQNRVRISDPFLGPFSIDTLSTGSKNGVPFLGPRFGRWSTATTFTLELAFGTMKSGRGSKKQQKEQGGSSSLHVRMYALVLAPCSNSM